MNSDVDLRPTPEEQAAHPGQLWARVAGEWRWVPEIKNTVFVPTSL